MHAPGGNKGGAAKRLEEEGVDDAQTVRLAGFLVRSDAQAY